MKKSLSVLLALVLWMTAAFAAAEDLQDAWTEGLSSLLSSIDLTRDMLTLTMSAEDEISLKLKETDEEGGIVDLVLNLPDTKIHAQILQDQVFLDAGGTVMNLKYADLQAASAYMPDTDMLGELLQLAAEKILLPRVRIDSSDGTHVTYYAGGSELLADLSEYLDAVLAEEKYYPTIDRILSLLATLSDSEIPGATQLAQMWPEAKESLLSQEADFHVSFELNADSRGTEITLTGEAGNDREAYLTDWRIHTGRETFSLKGKLAQRIVRGEESREFPITVDGSYDRGLWSFSVDFPAQRFSITAEGSHADGLGRYSFAYRNPRSRILPYFYSKGSYAAAEDGFSGSADIRYMPGTQGTGQAVISVMMTEELADLLIMNGRMQKVFGLKAMTSLGDLKYLSLESELTQEIKKAVYDGEKCRITSEGMDVIVTGAFESDHAYVLTLHPEYTDGREAQEGDAYIRLEYNGEEGNFSLWGSLIDPEENTLGGVRLDCAPTEGIGEKLSDRSGIIFLTPDTLLQLLKH